MKWLLFFFVFLVFENSSCTKSNDNECSMVMITNKAPGCGGWGIVADNTKYPSRNIPDEFKIDGLPVCASYELYSDPALCVCCGGTWADIKSMKKVFVR